MLALFGLALGGLLARRGRAREIDKDALADGRALDASFAPNLSHASRSSGFDIVHKAPSDDVEQVSVAEPTSATPTSALEAARASGARAGRDVVLVAFANGRVSDATINWAKHLSRTGSRRMRHVLGALDDVALERARKLGVFAYAATHEDLDHGAAHASENWRAFCAMMIAELKTLIEEGYDVVLSDVDVAWMRDAAPYFLCEEAAKADGCEDIMDADVMISSDNLSPTKDWNEGARYARAGIFNTGVVFVRSTPCGKEFMRDWWTHLTATSGPYAKLTSHQQVFNKMVRQENAWPGLDVRPGASERTRVLVSGSALSSGNTFALGILPLRLFTNGHGYFVQRVNLRNSRRQANGDGDAAQPYAVHATYTFDGSGNDAKRYRFQEVGLWLGEDEVGASSDQARYLTFDAPTVRVTKEEADIGDHVAVARANVRALRTAFAYAAALNRTLAIPRLECRCDKVWGGHDNVFKAKCHYPGAEGEEYLPGVCPLDHFVSPSAIRRAGGVFVPAASAPPAATANAVPIDWSTSQLDDFSPTYRAHERYLTLGTVDDVLARAPSALAAAAARVDAVLARPERWCAECVPDRACERWISPPILALGSTTRTRGGTSESWCVDLA